MITFTACFISKNAPTIYFYWQRVSFLLPQELSRMSGRYYDFGSWETTMQLDNTANGMVIIFLGMVLGLFLYIINLIVGVIKKFNSK